MKGFNGEKESSQGDSDNVVEVDKKITGKDEERCAVIMQPIDETNAKITEEQKADEARKEEKDKEEKSFDLGKVIEGSQSLLSNDSFAESDHNQSGSTSSHQTTENYSNNNKNNDEESGNGDITSAALNNAADNPISLLEDDADFVRKVIKLADEKGEIIAAEPKPENKIKVFKSRLAKGSAPRTKIFITALLVAISLLCLSFVIKYISQNILFHSETSTVEQISDIQFIWGKEQDDIEGNVSKWLQATKSKPITKIGEGNYLRIRFTVKPSDIDGALEIKTNHAPMKIVLDGKEIYNNYYGKSQHTGNNFNSAIVTKSQKSQEAEVYMHMPLAPKLTITLQPVTDSYKQFDINRYYGVVFSLVAIAIGVIMIFVATLLTIKSRNISKLIILGVTVAICGCSFFMYAINASSNILSAPVWCNMEFFSQIFIMVSIAFNVVYCYGEWKPPITIGLVTILFWSLCIIILPPSTFVFWIIGFYVLLTITAVFIVKSLLQLAVRRVQYSVLIISAFVYSMIFSVIEGYTAIFSIAELSKFISGVGTLIFCGAIFIAMLKQSLFTSIDIKERELQILRDSRWIESIAAVVATIFVQKIQSDFFIKSAEGLCCLIEENSLSRADQVLENSETEILCNNSVRSCVGVFENGEFSEIFNNGGIEKCNYNMIASRYSQQGSNNVIFSSSYFDMLFTVEDEVKAVMHFENIEDGLSNHFENIILTAYANMSIVFSNFNLKNDMVITQEKVFISLAEMIEFKSGATNIHLKNVAKITAVICRKLGYSEYDCRIISSAAMVHDIGKIAIPESIIEKKGKLTLEEKEIVKNHVSYGYNILSQSPGEFMQAAAIIAQQHHEMYDGTGYLKKSNQEIHVYARIVAVADVFDALTSIRSYKDAWPIEKAAEYINEKSGTQFDPEVIKIFNECIDEIRLIKENEAKGDIEDDSCAKG